MIVFSKTCRSSKMYNKSSLLPGLAWTIIGHLYRGVGSSLVLQPPRFVPPLFTSQPASDACWIREGT